MKQDNQLRINLQNAWPIKRQPAGLVGCEYALNGDRGDDNGDRLHLPCEDDAGAGATRGCGCVGGAGAASASVVGYIKRGGVC